MPNRNVYIPQELHEQLDIMGVDFNLSRFVQAKLQELIEETTNCCARCGQSLSYSGSNVQQVHNAVDNERLH